MGLGHSPKIVTDGLVVCLDPGNTKTYPGSLGSELVTTAALTAVDGSVVTVTTNGVSLCNVVAGKSYVLRYTVSAYRGTTGGTFRINLSASNYTPNLIGIGAVGTYYRIFTANVSGEFSFYPDNTGVDLDLDFVSVREMLDMSATTMRDLVTPTRTVSIVGAPLFTAPYFTMNADSKYISMSNSDLSHRTNDFTYSIWVKFAGVDSLDTLIENGSWTDTLLFRCENNVITCYAETTYYGQFPLTRTTGVWYNLTFVRTNLVLSFYVNGVATGTPFSLGADINLGVTTLWLMRSQHASSQNTLGDISAFHVYNRALSATEILQNFNALRGRYGL